MIQLGISHDNIDTASLRSLPTLSGVLLVNVFGGKHEVLSLRSRFRLFPVVSSRMAYCRSPVWKIYILTKVIRNSSSWSAVTLVRSVLWKSLLCSCSISGQFFVLSLSYPVRKKVNLEVCFSSKACQEKAERRLSGPACFSPSPEHALLCLFKRSFFRCLGQGFKY